MCKPTHGTLPQLGLFRGATHSVQRGCKMHKTTLNCTQVANLFVARRTFLTTHIRDWRNMSSRQRFARTRVQLAVEDLVWESAELITLRGDYSPVVVLFCLNALFISLVINVLAQRKT